MVISAVLLATLPVFVLEEAVLAGGRSTGDSARGLAERWVDEQGWSPGWDTIARRLVVISDAPVQAIDTPFAIAAMRNQAFEQALSGARRQLASFLAAEVATAARSSLESSLVIGNPDLARQLTGMAADSGFLESSEFEKFINVAANATLEATVPIQTFVSHEAAVDGVAMVVVWGPRVIDAVRGRIDSKSSGQSLAGWFAEQSDDELACSWGSRLRVDASGRWRVLAFGVAAIRPGLEEHAFQDAYNDAAVQLRRVVGEQVAAGQASEYCAKFSEGSAIPDRLASTSEFESLIAAESKAISVPMFEVGRRAVPAGGMSDVPLAVVALAIGEPSHPSDSMTNGDSMRAGASGCPPVEERMRKFVRPVRVAGVGPTESDAIVNALIEAVRRQGVQVEADSRLARRFEEAFESVQGEVHEKVFASTTSEGQSRAYSSGFVHSYEVLSRRDAGTQVEVQVCANLVRFDPIDPRFGLPPTLAVLPWVEGGAGIEVDGRRVAARTLSFELEARMEREFLKSDRFQLIESPNEPVLAQVRQDVLARAAAGRLAAIELVKLGREMTADYVLAGEIERVRVVDQAFESPSDRMVDVVLNACLVSVADGRVVWSGSGPARLDARTLAQARAGRKRDGSPLDDPAEKTLDPLQLGLSRASGAIAESLGLFLQKWP